MANISMMIIKKKQQLTAESSNTRMTKNAKMLALFSQKAKTGHTCTLLTLPFPFIVQIVLHFSPIDAGATYCACGCEESN